MVHGMNLIALVLVNLAGIFGWTTTPTTVAKPTIYVQSTLTGAYRTALKSAIKFDARYTHSKIVLHKCDTKHMCFIVKANRLDHVSHGTVLGETWYTGTLQREIHINTRYHDSQREKVEVIAHELGHALGLWNHNPRCTSLMYSKMNCHGHLPPMTFTASEKRILRKA